VELTETHTSTDVWWASLCWSDRPQEYEWPHSPELEDEMSRQQPQEQADAAGRWHVPRTMPKRLASSGAATTAPGCCARYHRTIWSGTRFWLPCL